MSPASGQRMLPFFLRQILWIQGVLAVSARLAEASADPPPSTISPATLGIVLTPHGEGLETNSGDGLSNIAFGEQPLSLDPAVVDPHSEREGEPALRTGGDRVAPLDSSVASPNALEGENGVALFARSRRPRRGAYGGKMLSFNKFHGLEVLCFGAMLWLVQVGLAHQGALKSVQSAYDGAPPGSSPLTMASHVLNHHRGNYLLLLVSTLPLWRAIMLSGALRVLASLAQGPVRAASEASPTLSGLFEVFAGLSILVGLEIPHELIYETLGTDLVRSLALGLLLIGLLLFSRSWLQIARWKKQRREWPVRLRGLRLRRKRSVSAEADLKLAV